MFFYTPPPQDETQEGENHIYTIPIDYCFSHRGEIILNATYTHKYSTSQSTLK